jgi:hypothetical protein
MFWPVNPSTLARTPTASPQRSSKADFYQSLRWLSFALARNQGQWRNYAAIV